MIRKFTYEISADFPPETTVLDFLRAEGYSHRILARLKRCENGIRIRRKCPEVPEADGTVRVRVCEKLCPGDVLIISLPEKEAGPYPAKPVDLPLDLVYEDEDLLVISKPAGMPVHPSVGNHDNTLANALAYRYRDPSEQFTCRIIDRLDKDTSGLLIVARNALAAAILCEDMKAGKIRRTYLSIVHHLFPDGKREGTIEAPIARVPGSAIERCVDFEHGERAVTHFKVLSQLPRRDLSLVRVRLETGRTHQIRVHMKYIGHPLAGDYLYAPEISAQDFIGRQALHSWNLAFTHPITKEAMDFTQPLPEDMIKLLKTENSSDFTLPDGAPEC